MLYLMYHYLIFLVTSKSLTLNGELLFVIVCTEPSINVTEHKYIVGDEASDCYFKVRKRSF